MNNEIPKYIYIMNKIKEGIKSGEIVDKLPGERILAKEFNVSYMTIRKATAILEEEGILHKIATKGTFVSHSKTPKKITHNIGFFLDEKIKEGISSPYYSLVFNALEKEVKKNGYNLILYSDFTTLNPLTNMKKTDGVVICCFPRLENKIQEIKNLIPIVLLDNLSLDKSIPSVTIDNYNSSLAAANHLIALGHKQIAFISGLLNSDVCKERMLGYSNALTNHNIKRNKLFLFKGDYSFESGERGAKYLLSLPKPPTAIMCANDTMAIGAMKVIRENGLNIPNDISVIGFDDIDVASKIFPPITTIAAPIKEIAEKSVELILSSINGNDNDYQHTILPAQLVVRKSCAPFVK